MSPPVLAELRKRRTFLVNYYPDVSFAHGDFAAEWLLEYDLVGSTKTYHLPWLADRMSAERFAHVHHGYSSLVHRRRHVMTGDHAFDWDICHVGNASLPKLRWLSGIAQRHPGKSILIAGNGWNAIDVSGELRGCEVQGTMLGDVYARTIERSRINLAMRYGPAGPQGWEDSISTRSFEIPACGSFMLHIDSDEVATLYRRGREIDVFSTAEEMHAKIAYYLDHPVERMAIAEAGHARAVPAIAMMRALPS